MTITESTPPTEPPTTPGLHLSDLVVKGFRGLSEIRLPRLGRVTLITGKNGIGKTTMLDAIRLFALGGSYQAISGLLRSKREYAPLPNDEDENSMGLDLASLFHGRTITAESRILIGTSCADNQLSIEVQDASDEQLDMFELIDPERVLKGRKILNIQMQGRKRPLPWVFSVAQKSFAVDNVPSSWYVNYRRLNRELEEFPTKAHIQVSPGFMSDRGMASLWDSVALTPDEDYVLEALNLVLGDEIKRVAFVGDTRARNVSGRRRCIVNLRSHRQPVPLQSLGDGALRLMRLSLALAAARNGLLLIDEIENGIHYSVQPSLWRMIFRIAAQNDVQVVATTHSSDCVGSFAKAAIENEYATGELVRMNVHDGVLYADPYSERQVGDAAEHFIDLR